jgi:DNA-binding response OmpR family regulator
MKKGAVDYLEKPINFDELFLRIEKIISVRSIMRNAQDLQQAMNVTENVASQTIQDLEIRTSQLQQQLDEVENILRDTAQDPEWRVNAALHKIAGI